MNDNREENIMEHVKNLWSRYLQWVAENPTLATDMETRFILTREILTLTQKLNLTELVSRIG